MVKKKQIVKGLENDVLTKTLVLLLNSFPMQSKEQLRQIMALSLVCKGFYMLLGFYGKGRVELKPFYSVKRQWLDTVAALDLPNEPNYLAYYKGCALSLQISKDGPVGYPKDTVVMQNLRVDNGERLAHFKSLHYLECQYLYLTEFAAFNKNQDWCYELLEKLRSLLLVKPLYTKHKFDPIRKLTDNEIKHKSNTPNIDKEHTVYLNSALLLVNKKPMKEHYDFRSEHHLNKGCTIM